MIPSVSRLSVLAGAEAQMAAVPVGPADLAPRTLTPLGPNYTPVQRGWARHAHTGMPRDFQESPEVMSSF